jgi:hypothetical protein
VRAALFLLVLVLSAVGVVACGGDDEKVSPAALSKRLLPASEVPGFKRERTDEWDNAIDLSAKGLFLPESTPTSQAVELIEDAGFEAAAGDELVVLKGNPFHGPRILIAAVQLGSDDDARQVLEFLHKEDLKQPCAAVCSEIPSELEVKGIPGAKGAQQLPQEKPPPNAPDPFVGYAVEFRMGSLLYMVFGGGGPGSLKSYQVTDAAKAFYERVRAQR